MLNLAHITQFAAPKWQVSYCWCDTTYAIYGIDICTVFKQRLDRLQIVVRRCYHEWRSLFLCMTLPVRSLFR